VNPADWTADTEHRPEELANKTINGVCVMNTSAVYPSTNEEGNGD
jgi:hypothetical protein